MKKCEYCGRENNDAALHCGECGTSFTTESPGAEVNVDRVEKVAVLENEVEAQLLDSLLSDQGIPHVMRSYHDSAYDGIFQPGGWGHIETPLSFHQSVARMIQEIRRQSLSSGTERADGEEARA